MMQSEFDFDLLFWKNQTKTRTSCVTIAATKRMKNMAYDSSLQLELIYKTSSHKYMKARALMDE